MTSLYDRLFRYRARPDRQPFEDYLTEALADLLNRFPREVQASFVAHILGAESTAARNFAVISSGDGHFRWSTQYRIDSGQIIDLVLEIEDTPLIVIENKIGAGFQNHLSERSEDSDRAQQPQPQHQLRTYGSWLQKATAPDWGGALVLLTHWTPPPPNLKSEPKAFGVRHTNVVQWSELAKWLDRQLRQGVEPGVTWRDLVADLLLFLKDNDMHSEVATPHDLAALQVYVSSADRVTNTIETIWKSLQATWRPLCQQTSYPLEIQTDFGCVWKFRYLAKDGLRDCYLAIGIRYPGIGSPEYYGDVPAEDGPYFFVELGSDHDESALNEFDLGESWYAGEDLRIAMLPLREVPSDPDAFLQKATAWASDRMSEAAKLLK